MISQLGNITDILLHCCVLPVKFSYWYKFHVNVITGSGVIVIFIDKGFIRNLEIGNTSLWVLPNMGKFRKVRDNDLAEMSLIKYY